MITNDLGKNHHRQRNLSRLRSVDGQDDRYGEQAAVSDDTAAWLFCVLLSIGIILFIRWAVKGK